ncbi:MAG: succinylglutamate desuccinylase/aspartoacylase family protein [Plesiomonas sp.]|uniref:succinylglutamate desuccinylase/aspartoacylase family protein n=1 Tax=Plesiomonas sp. TaxID=2486279 RepID=UPI003F39A824
MSATCFTSDIIDGKKVVAHLNSDDLPAGKHQFYFRPLDMATGQGWYIPVTVLKGALPGKRILVTAGVHGDELNGVLTAQQLMRSLETATLSGTVTIVSGVNLPGILGSSRDFIPNDPDASPVNLNRLFPGNHQHNTAAGRYLANLWDHLFTPNADFTVDLHTQTRGAEYPLYVFADYRIEQCVKMARLMNPDCILDDPGDPGVLETEWNRRNVPCITVEVGTAKRYQPDMVNRSVEGIENILRAEGMLAGSVNGFVAENCYEGTSTTTLRANSSGYALPQVQLGDTVIAEQLVAIQWDAFGNEVERYYAPTAGQVLSINSDPLREAGSLLVRILHRS